MLNLPNNTFALILKSRQSLPLRQSSCWAVFHIRLRPLLFPAGYTGVILHFRDFYWNPTGIHAVWTQIRWKSFSNTVLFHATIRLISSVKCIDTLFNAVIYFAMEFREELVNYPCQCIDLMHMSRCQFPSIVLKPLSESGVLTTNIFWFLKSGEQIYISLASRIFHLYNCCPHSGERKPRRRRANPKVSIDNSKCAALTLMNCRPGLSKLIPVLVIFLVCIA